MAGTTPVVTVFGGTGFLGRRLVDRLLERGVTVRVAARHVDDMRSPGAGQNLQRVRADIDDAAAIAEAVEGADAVANAVSLYVEGGGATFRSIHVEGARRVAEAAARAKVKRLLHLSGVGSDAAARSRYIRCRGMGEEAVRAVFPDATLFRPCVMIGAGDAFLSQIGGLLRRLPAFPLFGNGATRLQPVWVEDVAEAGAAALAGEAERPGIHELGGGEILAYRDIVRKVKDHLGAHCLIFPMPLALWRAAALAAGLLPAPPVTQSQIDLMEADNVADPRLPGLPSFGLRPAPLSEVIATVFAAPGSGLDNDPTGKR